MTDNKSRFVLLCQQGMACAVVVLLAAPAAGVGSLDLVAPDPGAQSDAVPAPTAGALVAADPVEPTVTEVPLTTAATRARPDEALTDEAAPLPMAKIGEKAAGEVDAPRVGARSAPQGVDGFATVGVTWSPEKRFEDDEITVSVRSLADGEWSAWQDLHYDADHGPDPGSPEAQSQRFGTDPVVVGEVDDVQVRAVTSQEALPSGMNLEIVDPGAGEGLVREQPAIDTGDLDPAGLAPMSAEQADPVEPADPAETGDVELTGTPGDVTPKPRIFSRAQWGADERMRDPGSLRYFEVHAGFVHHTVNANGYTRAEVPSVIRGIYAFHTQSRGWSDIGYNFLVDRFGRIWEGRYGGVTRPVVGAHTLGYNDYAFAASAIGNFDTAEPSTALLKAYARLFAWKLNLHGIRAGDRRQKVGDRTLRAINGHRDAGQTACPGRYLYARLGTIRSKAVDRQRPFAPRRVDTDISGSRWPDLVVRDRRTHEVTVVRTGGQVGFDKPTVAATGLGDVDLLAATRDLTGDGRADLVTRDRATGTTAVRPGNGGGFGAPLRTTRRFRGWDQLTAVGDFDGDGRNDLVGRVAATKALVLVPGAGRGRFDATRTLAGSWAAYDLTAGAGDFDGDGDADLLARDHDGRLWLVPGNGRGSVRSREALPGRWGRFEVVAGHGDLTNDGEPDIVARTRKSQRTFFYRGDGDGGLERRLGPFRRFRGVDFLASPGQVAGSRRADLVGRNAAGKVVVFTNRGKKNIGSTRRTGARFGNTNLILNVGDWDGDGRNDLMTRRTSNGRMLFRAGLRKNAFAAPVVAARGWGSTRLVAAVGDVTGDGYPDLMAQPGGGTIRVYPSDGRTGFARSFAARSAVSGTALVGPGLWTKDGAPDSIVRRKDGSLWLYRGNGPGGLTGSATQVGGKARRYDSIVGAGDVDGDGRPDLIARQRATGDLWLLPGAKGRILGTRRLIATGFDRYDLIG